MSEQTWKNGDQNWSKIAMNREAWKKIAEQVKTHKDL
jgi:hypothetical protein